MDRRTLTLDSTLLAAGVGAAFRAVLFRHHR
jgi:hypothetical protein